MKNNIFPAIVFLVILTGCGGGGSGQSSNSSIGTGEPPRELTPVPTIDNPLLETDMFRGELVSDIVAQGFARHIFWSEYWRFVERNTVAYNTQREIDEAWGVNGAIAFKPQQLLCKKSYVSPFEPNELAPTLELFGNSVVDIPRRSVYQEPGYRAYDHLGNDISERVVVSGLDKLDTIVSGNYLLTYHVVDAEGNSSRSVGRMVRVYVGPPQIEGLYRKGDAGAPMSYFGFVPQSYGDFEDQRYPVVIHFHGWSGSADFGPPELQMRGGTAEAARQNGLRLWPEGPEFLVFQPQRSRVLKNDLFTASVTDPTLRDGCETREFVDYIIQNYKVDPSRIYFVGFSNGVAAVLEYLRSFNDRAAATVLIAGAGWLQGTCDFAHIPHWGLMGGLEGDANNPRTALWRNINEQRNCPGEHPKSKFTVVPDVGHVSLPFLDNSNVGNSLARTDPFDTTVWEWLLQFENHWLEEQGSDSL